MKLAMGALAVLAIVGGVLQIPRRQRGAAPLPRADVRGLGLYEELEPSDRADRHRHGRRRGARRCSASSSPTRCGCGGPERAGAAPGSGSRRCTGCSSTSGTSTRRSTSLFVRPVAWLGRFARTTFERVFVRRRARRRHVRRSSALASAAVRARADRLPALLRRAAADGHHVARRLLPDRRMTIHLSILIFWPLACSRCSARSRRARSRRSFALVGALVPLGYAVILLVDFDYAARSAVRHRRRVDPRARASATRSASTG